MSEELKSSVAQSAAAAGPVAQFPEKLVCLFERLQGGSALHRFIVLYGGRGAGRSWGVARALLIMGKEVPLRILCARELQKSIGDSVHQLLKDQIELLGMGDFYEVQRDRIIGLNGTIFRFEGIKNNINAIRSFEGVDICWVEEAAKVTKNSWRVLLPTIRKEGSQIILTFNPELEEDFTFKRFVTKADGRMLVVKMNWRDNPWFPETLRADMEADREEDEDEYLHVWEGECLQQLEGAIYAKQLRRASTEGRITQVPYNREVPVSTFWDLGRADKTAIWFVQRVGMQWRLLEYFEDCGEDIDYYIKECQRKEYIYDTFWLPHDAKHSRLGQPKSILRIMRDHGFRTRVVPKLGREEGINAARLIFSQCWFDAERCEDGLGRLRHYRYDTVDGHLTNEPLHDDASDGADAFRYFAVAAKLPGKGSAEILARLKEESQKMKEEAREAGLEFSGRPRGFGSAGAGVDWMGG